jgi:DNA-binding CsgD family transcriptional regulator/PAS domain-containing protein
MVTLDDFSRLVAAIYAAGVNSDLWIPTLEDLQRVLGGTGAGLLVTDGSNRSGAMLNPEAAKTYAEHYSAMDHVLAAVERGPVGVVRSETELLGPNPRSEFYADWVLRYELDDGMFVRLDGGPRTTCFAVAAPKFRAAFDSPEPARLLDGLIVHLQQAVRTQRKLEALANRSDDFARAWEALPHGAIIVGPGGLVIQLNSVAEAILCAQDGVQQRAGCLITTSPQADDELRHALRDSLAGDGAGVRRGRTFVCRRPSGARPYVLHVNPLLTTLDNETYKTPTALVMITDPERASVPATELLQRLYSLTSAEAAVALRISRGDSTRDVAEQLSVTYQTVRTHLQHIYDKTGSHRQGELIRLILALNA